MAKYSFELVGCNASNLEAVKAAIATIPGVSFSIHITARGNCILTIECHYSEDEILGLLNEVLRPLGVIAKKVARTYTPPRTRF